MFSHLQFNDVLFTVLQNKALQMMHTGCLNEYDDAMVVFEVDVTSVISSSSL